MLGTTKKAVPDNFARHRFASVAPSDRFERSTPALGELCSVPRALRDSPLGVLAERDRMALQNALDTAGEELGDH